MLFKHGHLEKQLRERGKSATAEILSIKTEGEGNSMGAMFSDDSDLTTTWFLCRLDLRVTPPGEPPFEVRVHSRLNTLKSRGDTVPVLYDPDDHDKVVVDYKTDAKTAMDSLAEADRLSQELESGAATSSAGAGSGAATRIDRLQQLADLHDRGVLTDAEFAQEKARLLKET